MEWTRAYAGLDKGLDCIGQRFIRSEGVVYRPVSGDCEMVFAHVETMLQRPRGQPDQLHHGSEFWCHWSYAWRTGLSPFVRMVGEGIRAVVGFDIGERPAKLIQKYGA